jgi:hypothetical protein
VGKSYEAEFVNDELKGSENLSEEIPVKLPHPLEVIGSLPGFWASLPCVVIGEGWPAWLPILSSLGARVVALTGWPGFEEESVEEVPRLEVGSKGADRLLKQLPKDVLIFVSGSSMFMHGLGVVLAEKT